MDESKVDIERLKRIELDMLIQVDEICKKLGIQYFLVGGTLLGAVRHKGFIPWDDDIDIGMLRKDYNVFLREAQKLLPEYYFLQNYHTDPEFPMSYSKIRDSRTTFIETDSKRLNINHGVFIDVFALDFYPQSKIRQSINRFFLRILDNRIFKCMSCTTVEKKLAHTLNDIVSYILFPSSNYAKLVRDFIYRSSGNSDKVINYGGAWGIKEIIDSRYVSKSIMLPFEGLDFPCPYYYDEYLRHIYGDYMKLPPVEKRVSHHYTEVIDINKSYKEYINNVNS